MTRNHDAYNAAAAMLGLAVIKRETKGKGRGRGERPRTPAMDNETALESVKRYIIQAIHDAKIKGVDFKDCQTAGEIVQILNQFIDDEGGVLLSRVGIKLPAAENKMGFYQRG